MINKNKIVLPLIVLFALLTTNNKPITEQRKSKLFFPRNKIVAQNQTDIKDAPSDAEKEIYRWFRTISEVVSLTEKKAFRNVDFSAFIQEALKAAVPHIDAHSAFFSKESYKTAIETTSGEFSGIGVSIINKTPEDDTLIIVDVIPGGPSEKGGLKSGDKILEVDGEKLRSLSTDEAINKLKGKVGTEVKLTIIRDKKPVSFKIKREIIKDQTSICYLFKNQNIYYLSLKLFTETAAKQMKELLKQANEGKCKGIILDLRGNAGGILDSAVDVAGLFLEKNSLVVTTKDREGETVSKYYTKTDPVLKSDIPIFILINNFTASASEILAGCLKYYSEKSFTDSGNKKRNLAVFLLGNPSFGKGSVQEVIPISNGCALKLTTMLYYLPNQESIQAVGINPDFVIKPKIIPTEDLKWIQDLYGKETTLKHHITVKEVDKNNGKEENGKKEDKKEIDKNNNETDKKEDEKSFEEKQKDDIIQNVQIQAAVNMINLLDIARKYMPKQVSSRPKAINFLKLNYLTDEQVDLEKIK